MREKLISPNLILKGAGTEKASEDSVGCSINKNEGFVIPLMLAIVEVHPSSWLVRHHVYHPALYGTRSLGIATNLL